MRGQANQPLDRHDPPPTPAIREWCRADSFRVLVPRTLRRRRRHRGSAGRSGLALVLNPHPAIRECRMAGTSVAAFTAHADSTDYRVEATAGLMLPVALRDGEYRHERHQAIPHCRWVGDRSHKETCAGCMISYPPSVNHSSRSLE